jgi:hypothetical protein
MWSGCTGKVMGITATQNYRRDERKLFEHSYSFTQASLITYIEGTSPILQSVFENWVLSRISELKKQDDDENIIKNFRICNPHHFH